MPVWQGCMGCGREIHFSSRYCFDCACGDQISVHTRGGSRPHGAINSAEREQRVLDWLTNVDNNGRQSNAQQRTGGTWSNPSNNRSFSTYSGGSTRRINGPDYRDRGPYATSDNYLDHVRHELAMRRRYTNRAPVSDRSTGQGSSQYNSYSSSFSDQPVYGGSDTALVLRPRSRFPYPGFV
jgi:hypothetical protein